MDYPSRLQRLRAAMAEAGVASLLVTRLPDVVYLCGFTGSNAVLAVTAKHARLYTDGRYTAQAKQEAQGVRVVIAKRSALEQALTGLVNAGAASVHFDGDATSVALLRTMHETLAKHKKKSPPRFLKPLKHSLVAELRMMKDAEEIACMQAAADLGSRLFDHILAFIHPGVTEVEVAARLEYAARKAGAEAMSFPTIVASGLRSAMPHGTASTARIPRRGFVTLDFGVILSGYCSDMTRTVHVGKATLRERKAYEAVREAQEQGLKAVKAGVKCLLIDRACRSVLKKHKLDKYFTHSTGHGVGLEIHEPPRLARQQETRLTEGMVVTIEPGVYLPGYFGIRIEDTVSVTSAGANILTKATKAWIEL